jgi:hypothetical protein
LEVRLIAIAFNTYIDAMNYKEMKATPLGLWYMQIPSGLIVNPLGVIIEPRFHKGSWYIVKNRKTVAISGLPKLDYKDAMEFKNVFC